MSQLCYRIQDNGTRRVFANVGRKWVHIWSPFDTHPGRKVSLKAWEKFQPAEVPYDKRWVFTKLLMLSKQRRLTAYEDELMNELARTPT